VILFYSAQPFCYTTLFLSIQNKYSNKTRKKTKKTKKTEDNRKIKKLQK